MEPAALYHIMGSKAIGFDQMRMGWSPGHDEGAEECLLMGWSPCAEEYEEVSEEAQKLEDEEKEEGSEDEEDEECLLMGWSPCAEDYEEVLPEALAKKTSTPLSQNATRLSDGSVRAPNAPPSLRTGDGTKARRAKGLQARPPPKKHDIRLKNKYAMLIEEEGVDDGEEDEEEGDDEEDEDEYDVDDEEEEEGDDEEDEDEYDVDDEEEEEGDDEEDEDEYDADDEEEEEGDDEEDEDEYDEEEYEDEVHEYEEETDEEEGEEGAYGKEKDEDVFEYYKMVVAEEFRTMMDLIYMGPPMYHSKAKVTKMEKITTQRLN
jgi:hypothetical protein